VLLSQTNATAIDMLKDVLPCFMVLPKQTSVLSQICLLNINSVKSRYIQKSKPAIHDRTCMKERDYSFRSLMQNNDKMPNQVMSREWSFLLRISSCYINQALCITRKDTHLHMPSKESSLTCLTSKYAEINMICANMSELTHLPKQNNSIPDHRLWLHIPYL
jgi:hypothetical protein